jgi:hypothetical protein
MPNLFKTYPTILFMKKCFVVIILVPLLLSCTNDKKNSGEISRIKKEVIDFASTYVNEKLKDPKETVSADGIITIGEDKISYIIDPSKIYVGLIDDDNNKDAIISIDYIHNQYLVYTEHLILINTDGKLILNRALESDMKILGIDKRVITAEIYTKSRNSPLANCGHCKEVVRYRFKTGDLIKVE